MDARMKFSAEYGARAPKSVCLCGHTGDGACSQHGDTVQAGHGACEVAGCACEKFSWAYYLPLFLAALKKEEVI